jgi:Carboxypeptidase regulatory-like domain
MLQVKRSLLPHVAVLIFSLVAACGSIHAQGLGSIVGTLTDPSGAAIAAAPVTVTDQGTSQTRQTVTNEQGYFVVPSLAPSTYSVKAEVSGFATYVQTGHRLTSGSIGHGQHCAYAE